MHICSTTRNGDFIAIYTHTDTHTQTHTHTEYRKAYLIYLFATTNHFDAFHPEAWLLLD